MSSPRLIRRIALAGMLACAALLTASDDKSPPAKAGSVPEKLVLSGRVVLLNEALRRQGIKLYDEDVKGQVVLETGENELWPLVPDWRGRAFFQDARLRDRPVDLIVNRRRGVPYVQVLSVFTFDDQGARQLTDYWCDICSIPMYEMKACECCQGPIRLRFQRKDLPSELQTGEAHNRR